MKRAVLLKLCLVPALFLLAGSGAGDARAAVYGADIARILNGPVGQPDSGVILVQRGEGGARRGNGGGGGRGIGGRGEGGRAIGPGGGGRGAMRGGDGSGRGVMRGPRGDGRIGRDFRSSPAFRGGPGREFRGGTVRRGDRAFRRGGVVRRDFRGRRWGDRGRRFRRGGRWYVWAPWAGSYVYHGSYQACYRTCRVRGYSRPYCRDLCSW